MKKNLGESQELIEKIEEQSFSKESDEATLEIKEENEKLKKKINILKKEKEHSIVRLGEAMYEKWRAIQVREEAYEELRLAQEAIKWAEDLVKEKEKEKSLMIKEKMYVKKENNILQEDNNEKI